MIIIIVILILFSSVFEQIKHNEVKEISRRISRFVNSFNYSQHRINRRTSSLSKHGTSGGRNSNIPTIDEVNENRSENSSEEDAKSDTESQKEIPDRRKLNSVAKTLKKTSITRNSAPSLKNYTVIPHEINTTSPCYISLDLNKNENGACAYDYNKDLHTHRANSIEYETSL